MGPRTTSLILSVRKTTRCTYIEVEAEASSWGLTGESPGGREAAGASDEAVSVAAAMGAALLAEQQYRRLQELL